VLLLLYVGRIAFRVVAGAPAIENGRRRRPGRWRRARRRSNGQRVTGRRRRRQRRGAVAPPVQYRRCARRRRAQRRRGRFGVQQPVAVEVESDPRGPRRRRGGAGSGVATLPDAGAGSVPHVSSCLDLADQRLLHCLEQRRRPLNGRLLKATTTLLSYQCSYWISITHSSEISDGNFGICATLLSTNFICCTCEISTK